MLNRVLQRIAGLIVICALSFGCEHHRVDTQVPVESIETDLPFASYPLIKQKPLRMGVYYPPETESYECKTDKGYIAAEWTFPIGADSVELFDQVFANLFEDAVRVNARPPLAGEHGELDVIELILEEFTGCEASWPIVDVTVVTIEYRAILWAKTGERIAEWTSRGVGLPSEVRGGGGWNETDHLRGLTEAAMREAAANFVLKFEGDPKIETWLKAQNAFTGEPSLSSLTP